MKKWGRFASVMAAWLVVNAVAGWAVASGHGAVVAGVAAAALFAGSFVLCAVAAWGWADWDGE